MKKQKEFGIFLYDKDDNFINGQYVASKKKSLQIAKSIDLKNFDDGCYVEVWQKENDPWGASGEPIFKSDK